MKIGSRCLTALLLVSVLVSTACGAPALPEAEVTAAPPPTHEPTATREPPRRILFIGDSSIYYNLGHAIHLEQLAASASPPMEIEAWDLTSSATSIEGLWHKEAALSKGRENSGGAIAPEEISSGGYDVVVLYIGPHWYVEEPQREYAGKYAEVAEKAGARTVLYMGWPFDPRQYPTYENEDPFDYNAASVQSIADAYGVAVAPVALAWERAMELCPDVELYHTDADHPTIHGTHLSVGVMYATLFGQSPVGLPYRPTEGEGVTEEAAACLQQAAWETVVSYHAQE